MMIPLEEIILLLFLIANAGMVVASAIMLVVINKMYTEILKTAVIKQIGK